jgi:hypothetical protein
MAFKTTKGFSRIVVSSGGSDSNLDADSSSDTLTITAGTNVTFGTGDDELTINSSGSGGGTNIADADGDTKIQVEESSDEDKIRFDTAGTQRMVITNEGKVGIGVDAPQYSLDVVGDVRIRGNDIRDGSSTTAISFDGSNGHVTKIGQSTPSSSQVLSWDGAKAVWAAASAGSGISLGAATATFAYDHSIVATIAGASAGTFTTWDTGINIPSGGVVVSFLIECSTSFNNMFSSSVMGPVYKDGTRIDVPMGGYMSGSYFSSYYGGKVLSTAGHSASSVPIYNSTASAIDFELAFMTSYSGTAPTQGSLTLTVLYLA